VELRGDIVSLIKLAKDSMKLISNALDHVYFGVF